MQAPSVAQKRFALGLASGKPATVAYKLSHKTKMTGNALASKAAKARKSEGVKQELERLLAEPMLQPLLLVPCPEYEDIPKLIEHAVGVMVRLTTHQDPVVCMHAAVWLFDYARVLKEEKRAKTPKEDRAKILSDLRGLYAKALKPAPVIVDAAPADEGDPEGEIQGQP